MNNSKKNVLRSSFLGNAVEYYDFTLYGYILPIIASKFFPSSNTYSTVVFSFITYAVGFGFRPLGSIIFGYIGDTHGRKTSLAFSLCIMAFATILLGLTPTYDQVGNMSWILIIFARACQGLCMSGECAGALIFSMEHSTETNRVRVASLIASSSFLGAFSATIALLIFSSGVFPEWSWRACFIFGALAAVIGTYIRFHLPESPGFTKQHVPDKGTYFKIIRSNSRDFIRVILIIGISGITAVIPTVFLNMYFTKVLKYEMFTSLNMLALALFVSFLVGYFMHKFVKPKYNLTLIKHLLVLYGLVLIASLYFLTQGGMVMIMICQCGLCSLSVMIWSVANVHIFFTLPLQIRYTGLAVADSLAKSTLVGLSPIILWYLQNENIYWIQAYYVIFGLIFFSGRLFNNSKALSRENHIEFKKFPSVREKLEQ